MAKPREKEVYLPILLPAGNGSSGSNGQDGASGSDGKIGPPGQDGDDGYDFWPRTRPLTTFSIGNDDVQPYSILGTKIGYRTITEYNMGSGAATPRVRLGNCRRLYNGSSITDSDDFLEVDNTSGTVASSLDSSTRVAGKKFTLRSMGGAYNITITDDASKTIEGAASLVFGNGNNEVFTIQYDTGVVSGSIGWKIVGRTNFLEKSGSNATSPFGITVLSNFGSATNYLSIATNGFLSLAGTAIAYDDLQFSISSAKTPAVNSPTWELLSTTWKQYSFAVDDYIDVQANELPHWWKEGTAGDAHIHVALKDANSSGANRFAKFTVTFAYAAVNGVYTESPLTAELTIPTGSAATKHFYLDLGNLDFTGYLIGTHIGCNVKRIAATGGTEYASNIFITQCGIHLQKDTMGSRTETVK